MLSADVEPELRRRVRIAAAVRKELEREEAEEWSETETEASISQASIRAFERNWASEDGTVYDELAG